MALTIEDMTSKERLHRLVDELSEPEADDALLYLASRRADDDVDEWGSLSKMLDFAASETMRRMAEEERAAGLPPWTPESAPNETR
jgi:hypothetical protein